MNLILLGWGNQEICKLHEAGEVELCCQFCTRTRKDKAPCLLDGRLVFLTRKLERHVLKLGSASISCLVCNFCVLSHQMISLQGVSAPEAVVGEMVQN